MKVQDMDDTICVKRHQVARDGEAKKRQGGEGRFGSVLDDKSRQLAEIARPKP